MLSELYVPGDSFLHRMPPQYMLLALAAFCTLLFLFCDWGVLAAAGLLVLVVYRVAGLRLHHAVTSVRPAFWVLAFIFAAHVLTTDISQAAIVVVRFVLMILAASVVTLTTRTSEFVGGIEAMLNYAPACVPTKRIALAITLTIRFIPSVRVIFTEVRMAQKTRGLDRNLTATLVPLVVRTLRMADQVSEALEARSAGKL